MTVTRSQNVQRLLADGDIGPALGYAGTATSVATTSFTDPVRHGSTQRGLNTYAGQGRVIFPNRSSNDRERDVGALTAGGAGILAIAGPTLSFAPVNNEPYLFLRRGIRFEQINAAWLDALRDRGHQLTTPLSQVLRDGDLRNIDVDAWQASSTSLNWSYSDAAEHNDTGLQSLLLHYNSASNTMYLQQATAFHLKAGQQVYLAGLPKIMSGGPVYWDIWNDTTNARAGTLRTISGKGSHHVWDLFSPSTEGDYNLRLGAAAGTLVAWDAFPNHFTNGLYWKTSTLFDQSWKLHRLDEMEYGSSFGANWEDAMSRIPRPWRRRTEFTVENLREESNPNAIQVLGRTSLPAHDLFYVGQGRESEGYSEGESTTSNAEPEAVYLAFSIKVLGLLETRDQLGPNGRWQQLQRQRQATLDAHTVSEETPTAPGPRYEHHSVSL